MADSTTKDKEALLDKVTPLGVCDYFSVLHAQEYSETETMIPCKNWRQVTPPSKGLVGRGGAPIRATTFAEGAARKKQPVASGVLDYFPDAIVAVSEVSQVGNDQHNPGQPLFWNREKSGDEADSLMSHFMRRGLRDADGVRHSAKAAWRALALLQKEIEADGQNRS